MTYHYANQPCNDADDDTDGDIPRRWPAGLGVCFGLSECGLDVCVCMCVCQMNEWDPIVPHCRSSSAGQIHVICGIKERGALARERKMDWEVDRSFADPLSSRLLSDNGTLWVKCL